jgi:hypothetical protein
MGKRAGNGNRIDPEYQRWRRKYPRFPGVAEFARLIRDGKARRAWADIIHFELAKNASQCLPELVATYRTGPSEDVRLYVMMALEVASLSASIPSLAEVLQQGNPRFVPYAKRALHGINTPEARTVLWNAGHPDAVLHRNGQNPSSHFPTSRPPS